MEINSAFKGFKSPRPPTQCAVPNDPPLYSEVYTFNPLNAKLNPICHLLALSGTHHILHVSRIRVKVVKKVKQSHYRPGVAQRVPGS